MAKNQIKQKPSPKWDVWPIEFETDHQYQDYYQHVYHNNTKTYEM